MSAASVYNQFDADGSRTLDYAEFADLMRQNGHHDPATIDATFKLYDHNNDGRISYNEFMQHIHGGGVSTTYVNQPATTTTYVNQPVTTSTAYVHQPATTSTTYVQQPVTTSASYVHTQPMTTHTSTVVQQQPVYSRTSHVGTTYGGATAYNLQELFNQYDTDRDGYLNQTELYNFYNGSGVSLTQNDVAMQLKYIQPALGDRVSYPEFQRFVRLK